MLKRKVTERKGHGIVETWYAHDMLGRLTSVQNSHSAVRLHYDALDNLIAEEQTADLPDGYHYRSIYRHTYDVQTTTPPNGQEVAWLRYGSGHVHAMSLDRQPLFDFERAKSMFHNLNVSVIEGVLSHKSVVETDGYRIAKSVYSGFETVS